jgi:hypothetical protein
VYRLLGIFNFTRYAWIAFFYLTFWTTFAPLVLFLQISLENLFKVFCKWSKVYEWKIASSIFKIWNFSPFFKCFSFDLNKTPPEWNSPFCFQEGFNRYQLEVCNLDANFENLSFNIPIENRHPNWRNCYYKIPIGKTNFCK